MNFDPQQQYGQFGRWNIARSHQRVLVVMVVVSIIALLVSTLRSTSPKQHQPPPRYLININSADIGQVMTLPGVGPELAQSLVDYRRDNGPFTSIDQLVNVPGIGPKKLGQLQKFVMFDSDQEKNRE